MYGELIPTGSGDPIPLTKTRLRIGRRESCDIVFSQKDVSGHHCRLEFESGEWFVSDLRSRYGIKVAGKRIPFGIRQRLEPSDELTIAKYKFEIRYAPNS